MAEIYFSILGPMEARVDGEVVALHATRQRAILAMLLMSAGHVVGLDRLTDAVWDGDPPPTARRQIHICISALRRNLRIPGLISTGELGYGIKVRPEQFDFALFEAGVRRGRAALSEGSHAEARHHLATALSRWRGDALAGVRGRAARAIAVHLEEARVGALEDLIEARLALGEHRDLVDDLVELVEQFPLRERIRAALMLALYRSSRQAEALAQFRRARAELREELGIEPGESLCRLHQAILAQDDALHEPVIVGSWPAREEVRVRG
jgi:DNA-binding SARP family transcriptional activator